jgi:class 3 adenylate cyclase
LGRGRGSAVELAAMGRRGTLKRVGCRYTGPWGFSQFASTGPLPGASTSPPHARRAIDAAHALVASLDGEREARPWPPVAVGVHTGTAWLGLIPGPHGTDDLTALGDSVNVAAHLCAAAGAGEVAISSETWSPAGVPQSIASRSLRLKRRRRPIAARFSGAPAQSCLAVGGGESKSLRYSP